MAPLLNPSSSQNLSGPVAGPVLYELRKYRVANGRLKDEMDRALTCIRPVEEGGRGLFARHGIPNPVGLWTVLVGPEQPSVLFLYRWANAASRAAAFNSFYQDAEWIELRADSNGGSEIVDRLDDQLLMGPDLRSVPETPFYSFALGDNAGLSADRLISLVPLSGECTEMLHICAHSTIEAACQAGDGQNGMPLICELSYAWPQ
ncbi:NIPSNAP family protein [Hoeflea sp.]|uniref:NIPSNAP family protein n=1 Tax=Hoeflea sp. TaxID=1940281 RepID=UPI003A8EFFD4